MVRCKFRGVNWLVDLDGWMIFQDHQQHQISLNKYIAQPVVCISFSPSILANWDREIETSRLHERSMVDWLDIF